MKTCATTWFACHQNAETMSWREIHSPKTLEILDISGIASLKHIVTIPHDWLVKRIFVYIIRKRRLFKCATIGFARNNHIE